MNMVDLILKKRGGGILSRPELEYFIAEYVKGNIPDYQAAALLMAIWFRGMNAEETGDLTMVMADSGDRVDLSSIPGIKVDKHSTGGVGDKTTMIVAPIVAACGVPVAKMSGRGLGYSGGTIDKLESIPGLSTTMPIADFLAQIKEIGLGIAGQTADLAPADKMLYALRDVTGTVDQASLIASSIMSKKIASGADKIVLDVKAGSGAFMKTVAEAAELAEIMVQIAEHAGLEAVALVTDMDRPLGLMIGNLLEVKEAVGLLQGEGEEDLQEICNLLAANMLLLAGKGDLPACQKLAREAVASGRALEKLALMVEAQGGDPEYIRGKKRFPTAKNCTRLTAAASGYIHSIRTDDLGRAAVLLGAGRLKKEAEIDPLAGLVLEKKTGDYVREGDLLANLHYNRVKSETEIIDLVSSSFIIKEEKIQARPLILARISSEGQELYEESSLMAAGNSILATSH